MTREEKIDEFLEIREDALDQYGAWRLPASGALWKNWFATIFSTFFVMAIVGFFLYIPLSLEAPEGAVVSVVIYLAFVTLCIAFSIYQAVQKERATKGVFFSKDALVYRPPLGKERKILLPDISSIKVRSSWGGNDKWFVYSVKGVQIPVPPELTLPQTDFPVFMRSTFLDLIWDENEVKMDEKSISFSVLNLYALVLKSDGNGTEETRDMAVDDVTRHFFQSGRVHRRKIAERLNGLLATTQQNYQYYCNNIVEQKRWNYGARYDLLDRLFDCAYKSDGINGQELEILRGIGKFLLLREWHIVSLEHQYELGKKELGKETGNFLQSYEACLQEARRELNVAEDAPLSEMKRVYEFMIKKWDPALLPAETPVADREKAKIRYRTIKDTYWFLKANMKE